MMRFFVASRLDSYSLSFGGGFFRIEEQENKRKMDS